MSVQGFVMSLMHGARGKDAAKALILPYIFGEAVGNQSYPVAESSGSAPLEIENAAAKDLLSFKTNIVPVQDLHGYDKPWPGGGGVNKLSVTADNVVIGKYISNSGAVTSNVNNFYVNQYIPVTPSTEYGLTITTPISYCSVMEYDEDKTFISRTLFTCTGSTQYETETQILTLGATTKYVLIGANLDNSSVTIEKVLSYKYQFQTGMFNGFTPYENKCPIQGWQTITGWIDGKYGGNIEWNQLESNGKFDTGNGWGNAAGGDAVFSNNEVTLTFTSNPSKEYTAALIRRNFSNPANHKVVISMDVYVPRSGAFNYDSNGTLTPNSGKIADTEANKWTHIALIATSTGVTQGVYVFPKAITNGYEAGDSYKITNFNIFDLTLMFGAGNEPSTVDEFRALFPADYYPYNAGTTTCVGEVNGDEYRKIPVTFGVLGKNLMNPDVFYTYSNWKKDLVSAPSSPTSSGNKGLALDVKAGVTYSITLGITSDNFPANCYLCSASNDLSSRDHEFTGAAYKDNTYTFTAQADTLYYFRLGSTITESSFNTAVGKISYVQLEVGSPTAYEPYTTTVYSGTYDFVTGELESDSAYYDLTGRSWTLNSGAYSIVLANGLVKGYYGQSATQAFVSNYALSSHPAFTGNDFCFVCGSTYWSSAECRLAIKDSNYSDATSFGASMSGQYCVYKLATPLTFHLDPADIKLLKGTNYLWADCGDTVSASYPTTLHTEDITLTGVSPLLLANSQAKKMSQCEVNIVATQEGSGDPYPYGSNPNLIPEGTDTANGYVDGKILAVDNTMPANPDAFISEYFPVTAESDYELSATRQLYTPSVCFYDSNKDYISGVACDGGLPKTITTPVGAVYARCTQYKTTEGNHTIVQFETGSSATTPIKRSSNIRPIHGVSTLTTTISDNSAGTGGTTYSTVFGCMGKNKFGLNENPVVGYINTSGDVGVGTGWFASDYISVLPSTEYTFSPNTTAGDVAKHAYYDSSKNFLGYIASGQQTFTTPADCAYMRFSYRDTSTNIQLEFGSSASSYQPYTDECYGGTFNELTGDLTLEHQIVDLGTLTWYYSTQGFFYATISGIKRPPDWNTKSNLLCECYTAITGSQASTAGNMGVAVNPGSDQIRIRDERYSDATAFTTSVNGVQFVYELATPITKHYDPHAIKSLAGHTYVLSNGGGNITATYKGVDLS